MKIFSIAVALCMVSAAVRAELQVFDYDVPDTAPIVYSAESWAEGARAKDCCLWLDVHYTDGTATWGTGKASKNCRQGTHGWEKTVGVFRPEKPVKKIEFNTLFRGGTKRGTVKYRNMRIERREPRKGEETSDFFWDDYPYTGEPRPVPGIADDWSLVWVADSMEKVTPLTFPFLRNSRFIELELAANERESAQICITAGRLDGWEKGGLELTPFRREDGKTLSGKVIWQRIGYIPRRPGGTIHSLAPDPSERWIPDPLLPAGPFRVRGGSTQGLWLTAYAAPDAAPGIYRGEARVLRDGQVHSTVSIALTVRDFALPHRFGMNVSFSVMDGFTRLQYPDDFRAKRRESWDVMLDHRLSPDDISRFKLPDLDELEYAKSRGMNLFNILNIVPEPKDPNTPIVYTTTKEILFSDWFYPSFRDRLVPFVKELRKRGLADMAYIYGFDEQQKEYYPAIEMFWNRLRKDVPGIPLMSTSKAYRDIAANPTNPPPGSFSGDWMCPVVNDWNPRATEELRRRGKKVWWYTCLSPTEPYPNFANLEEPFTDGRILGWATHRVGADGFLFWIVNFWKKGVVKLDESETYFPDWVSGIGNTVHGDGVLLYPGRNTILPSIRLANVRDGVEDAEWLKAAEARAGKEAAAALCADVVRTSTDFTRDPSVIRLVRNAVGDLIEGRKPLPVKVEIRDPAAFAAARELRRCLAGADGSVVMKADRSLGPQEWRLRCDGKTLTVIGRNGLGAAYGAFNFLEKYAGCRWFADDTEVIPDRRGWKFPVIDERGCPTVKNRFFYPGSVPVSGRWRFLNRETRTGGIADTESTGSPRDNHSFGTYASQLDPPREWLCLTDPAVRKAVAERMKKYIRDDRTLCHGRPEYEIPLTYELSQSDGGKGFKCGCRSCLALRDASGSWSGPNIAFTSAVAEEVKKEFPDVKVRTFAYSYTERAPTNGMIAADNLVARFCRSFLFQPLTATTDNGRVLREWDKCLRWKYVWGYWRSYSGPLFPAVKPRADIRDELRFCRDMHVLGYFAEAESPPLRSFGTLQHWLFLKFAENPDQDVFALADEFIDAYYGAAAEQMKVYLDYLEKRQKAEYAKVDPAFIRDITSGFLAMYVQRGYLDRQFFATVNRLLDEAERLVAGDPRSLAHVLQERRVVDRAMISEFRPLLKAGYAPDVAAAAKRIDDPHIDLFAAKWPVAEPAELKGRDYVEWTATELGLMRRKARRVVRDDSSAVGFAVYDAEATHALPFIAGAEDDWSATSSSVKLEAKDIPQDEKYHLVKIGPLRLECESMVYLGRREFFSWMPPFAPYIETRDVWVSVKFEGPAYVKGSKRSNRVSYDRIFFVKK